MTYKDFKHFTALGAFAVGLGWPAALAAQEMTATNAPEQFGSSDAAIRALREATAAGNRKAVDEIFGPEIKDFLTGDPVQDQAHFKGFSEAMAQGCVPVPAGTDRLVLDLGTNQWPFPIPLVKDDGRWHFDTDDGREEIIDRHIGRDELNAIGVCRAYVRAQRKYFSQEHDGSGVHEYALRFNSTPGKQDGLYWPSANEASPLGPLVAQAHAQGYQEHPAGTGPHPFHGYLFRILTQQGRAAPDGQRSYLVNGDFTGGFALVAYPDKWGHSGIMTFIVNQDGQVYQRNLGDKTGEIAASMTQYNPNRHWTVVKDPGVEEP